MLEAFLVGLPQLQLVHVGDNTITYNVEEIVYGWYINRTFSVSYSLCMILLDCPVYM